MDKPKTGAAAKGGGKGVVQQAMSKAKIISVPTDPRELSELLESFADFKHDVMQMLLKQVCVILSLTLKGYMTFDLDLRLSPYRHIPGS